MVDVVARAGRRRVDGAGQRARQECRDADEAHRLASDGVVGPARVPHDGCRRQSVRAPSVDVAAEFTPSDDEPVAAGHYCRRGTGVL